MGIFRKFQTYNVCDDWGRRYERELDSSMVNMPGAYPGAQIEEVWT